MGLQDASNHYIALNDEVGINTQPANTQVSAVHSQSDPPGHSDTLLHKPLQGGSQTQQQAYEEVMALNQPENIDLFYSSLPAPS